MKYICKLSWIYSKSSPHPTDYSMNLKLFSKFYFLCQGKEYIWAYIYHFLTYTNTRIYIIVEDEIPQEDYKFRKWVVSDSGTREDLLISRSFSTLVIYHVFTSRNNKCTSKVGRTQDRKWTMAEKKPPG